MTTKAAAGKYPLVKQKSMAKVVLRSRRVLSLPAYPRAVAVRGQEAATRWLQSQATAWLRVIAKDVPEDLWHDALTQVLRNSSARTRPTRANAQLAASAHAKGHAKLTGVEKPTANKRAAKDASKAATPHGHWQL